MSKPRSPIIEWHLCISLNYSSSVAGSGKTPTEARRDLMANALRTLKEPSLRRVEAALNPKEDTDGD
jgi:hypothetical protein